MDGHELDRARHRDDGPARFGLQRGEVHHAAAVDHVEHRQDRAALAAAGRVEKADDLVQRAAGERRGNDGDYDEVGGAQHLFAGLGEAGRAVEQDAVVGAAELFDEAREAALLAEPEKEAVEIAQARVGGEEVEARRRGAADEGGGGELTGEDRARLVAPDRWVVRSAVGGGEDEGRGGLRVEVPEQGAPRGAGRGEPGDVDRQRGFADAPLQAVDRDRLHRPALARWRAGSQYLVDLVGGAAEADASGGFR